MINDVTIRLADMQDLEALCRLYVEFHEFHVRGAPNRLISLGEPHAYDCSEIYPKLEKIINSEDSAIFLTEVAGQPAGLAEVYVRQDQLDPARVSRKYAYLQSLMVREQFRWHGAETRLLETTEEWAKEKGATKMRLETWEFAEGPLGFYEHRGYRTLRRTLLSKL